MTSQTTPKKTITLERTFEAALEDVWTLWTTKEGLESWWGPEGFTTAVRKIDVRVGGEMLYAMTATAPQQIAFMEKAGLTLTTEQRVTYDTVVPQRRLAYTNRADFIPGVAPYDVATLVDLHPNAQSVRMVVTIDAMHDEPWTKMAVLGWESQLGRLVKLLAERPRPTGR
jgi:uncharacterized protein YndB with AHSA1/START domain